MAWSADHCSNVYLCTHFICIACCSMLLSPSSWMPSHSSYLKRRNAGAVISAARIATVMKDWIATTHKDQLIRERAHSKHDSCVLGEVGAGSV